MPDDRRWWRFRYRYQGREKTLSLGEFPEVGIEEAEEDRDELRRLLRVGIDPSAKRRAERSAHGDTFRAVAEEWLTNQRNLSPDTTEQFRTRLTTYLYPKIGNHRVDTIEPTELLAARLLTWQDLLSKRRIVILAEAGSGKSTEMQEEARRLLAQQKVSFFATLQNVGISGLDGVLHVAREALKAWRNSEGTGLVFSGLRR